jgi:hypothetical protein
MAVTTPLARFLIEIDHWKSRAFAFGSHFGWIEGVEVRSNAKRLTCPRQYHGTNRIVRSDLDLREFTLKRNR